MNTTGGTNNDGDTYSYNIAPAHRAWAHRLVLAHIHDDSEAQQIVEEEIGGCANCWEDVAHMLAAAAADGWVYLVGKEEASNKVAAAVANALDDLETHDR